MHHIAKDVVSLITTPSQKDRFPNGPHILKLRASTQLETRPIVLNLCVAVVVTKRNGFSSMLTFQKKKTNQHRTLYLDPQRTGFINVKFCYLSTGDALSFTTSHYRRYTGGNLQLQKPLTPILLENM